METSPEIWKDIDGYDGDYQVSSLGRIRTWKPCRGLPVPRIRICVDDSRGYSQVCLSHKNHLKTIHVHTLVAKAFIPNPHNFKEINHKDENKKNNCVDNLEWCTRKYNINFGLRTQKTSKPVMRIGPDGIKVFKSMTEAAKCHNDSISNISRATKKGYKAKGYYWKEVVNYDTL